MSIIKFNVQKSNVVQGKNIMKRFVTMFILVVMVFFYRNETYVKAKEVLDNEYVKACEEALAVIQYMNEEKLDVRIGDIYNVVDIEGKLDGYSLGYFVGNTPYGYAIFGIDSNNIREFVFDEGIENLYKQLEEKAENSKVVDEDNLIEAVVYDGGINYSTYDTDGNKIEYSGDDIQESCETVSCSENQEKEYTDKILNSKYVAPGNSKYSGDIFEMCNSKKYWDLYSKDTFLNWSIIPDSGMAMITQSYSEKMLGKYCCTVNSVIGILNWLGYDNVVDNYNDIWKNCPIEIQNQSNGVTYGGAFLTPIAEYLNNIYFKDTTTRAYIDNDVTFDDVVNNITNTVQGERVPFSMSIWINKINPQTGEYILKSNGEIDTDAHTVTVLSYFRTKQDNYVGIFNSWEYDAYDKLVDGNGLKNDVSNATSYYSVRYINYNDLKNCDNVFSQAMMLKNVSSKRIRELGVNEDKGNGIQLACIVPNGTFYVECEVYTLNNGKDDLYNYRSGFSKISYNGIAYIDTLLSWQNNESGVYCAKVKAYNSKGKVLAESKEFRYNVTPRIYNVEVKEETINGYTVQCELPRETVCVKFPTWRDVNGQQEGLKWYEGSIINEQGTLKRYSGRFTFNVSDCSNLGGKYITHIYAYDKYNNVIACVAVPSVSIIYRTKIRAAELANSTTDGYIAKCYVPTGTKYVYYYTYPNNRYEEVRSTVSEVKSKDGFIAHKIYIKNHKNIKGIYHTEIHAYDKNMRLLDRTAVMDITIN